MPPTHTTSNNQSNNNSFDNSSLPLQQPYDETASSPSESCEPIEDEQKKETIIVFDWDDTILSSTFLASKGYRLDSNMSNASPELLEALASLSESVIAVLKLAKTYGRVVVITNAETGWVELSCAKFIPTVLPYLTSLDIQVLSARSTFECEYPDSPLKWKCAGFSHILSPYLNNDNIFKNILSFGDSHVEREAVRSVTMSYNNTLCKSVKFAERPNIEQLKRQIQLIINCMEYIYNHNNHLDLQLTVTINENETTTQEQQKLQQEKEEKMKCKEQSSMPAHDDGNGCYNPSNPTSNTLKRSTSSYMNLDEDDDEIEEKQQVEAY
jgi:hypothetical protein